MKPRLLQDATYPRPATWAEDSPLLKNSRTPALRGETEHTLSPYASLMQSFNEAAQVFYIASESGTVITGRKGTEIHIEPGSLITPARTRPGGLIRVQLREITSKSGMLSSLAPSISAHNQLLECGGMFEIVLSCARTLEALSVREGAYLHVRFPVQKKAGEHTELFSGERNSEGFISWTPAQMPLRSSEEENKSYFRRYQEVKLRRTGWLLCGRLLKTPLSQPTGTLTFSLTQPEHIEIAAVHLIPRSFPAVSSLFASQARKAGLFLHTPVGEEVTILAICHNRASHTWSMARQDLRLSTRQRVILTPVVADPADIHQEVLSFDRLLR